MESHKIEQDLGEKSMYEPRPKPGKNEVEYSPRQKEAGHPVAPASKEEVVFQEEDGPQVGVGSKTTNLFLLGIKTASLGSPQGKPV